MGALQLHVFYLILLPTITSQVISKQGEWKSATATYTKQADASIITEGACGMGIFIRPAMGNTVQDLVPCCSTKGVHVELALRSDVLTISYGVSKGVPQSSSLLQIFVHQITGFLQIMVGGVISPRNTLRCLRLHLLKLQKKKAEIVPVQYKRVKCERRGGMRFSMSGSTHFFQVLITNVGLDGEVVGVKVKGSKSGWLPMARNWGQNWHSNINLVGQPLSFEVTASTGRTVASYSVAPANWQFGQTFEGKQFKSE
ncbi:hypothetical protein ES332_D12G013800v1 [Gossypium tomentosum]|uniref:Expansin n=2 Tax=Gossypium tomentosum TaxID=34277 RepID=A0A5D2I5E4_GOSTO|nr:hypothetical protein ES332_D12G013800v1 [Gossypium tomentosum]